MVPVYFSTDRKGQKKELEMMLGVCTCAYEMILSRKDNKGGLSINLHFSALEAASHFFKKPRQKKTFLVFVYNI